MENGHQNFSGVDNSPTQRAPDAGESGVIPSIFLRLSIFQSDGIPPPAPARVTQTVGRRVLMQKTLAGHEVWLQLSRTSRAAVVK